MEPLQAKPKEMVRGEPTNNHTAGVDTNHSIMFTLLLNYYHHYYEGGGVALYDCEVL